MAPGQAQRGRVLPTGSRLRNPGPGGRDPGEGFSSRVPGACRGCRSGRPREDRDEQEPGAAPGGRGASLTQQGPHWCGLSRGPFLSLCRARLFPCAPGAVLSAPSSFLSRSWESASGLPSLGSGCSLGLLRALGSQGGRSREDSSPHDRGNQSVGSCGGPDSRSLGPAKAGQLLEGSASSEPRGHLAKWGAL